MDTGAKAAGA